MVIRAADLVMARVTVWPGPYLAQISASLSSTGTGWPSGLVVMSQQVGEVFRRVRELAGQVAGEAEFGGAVQGAGVVGDQAAHHRDDLGVAEVASAVERVESGAAAGDGRGVADVVQPGSRDQGMGVMG
jgi:hypothetical protein